MTNQELADAIEARWDTSRQLSKTKGRRIWLTSKELAKLMVALYEVKDSSPD
jgi:hypothetical protein